MPDKSHTGVDIKWNSIPNRGRDMRRPTPDSRKPEKSEIEKLIVAKANRSESSEDLSKLN
tara:strand:+ start:705 stop:884 length:180 start_codon:yes stop_codon:yes gene_type:complete